MGQVIRLSFSTSPYPDAAAQLEPAECVLLLAMRWWVAAHKKGGHSLSGIAGGLDRAGVHEAAFSIDALMAIVARAARRPVVILCPRCPHVAEDEKYLLHAASLTQDGHGRLAERALRTALLSAQGAEFALGPLEGVGTLFAKAKLLFRCQRPPHVDEVTIESWRNMSSGDTFH